MFCPVLVVEVVVVVVGGANSFEPAVFPFGSPPPPLPVIMTGPNIGITLKEIFLDEHFLTSHMRVPQREPHLCRRPRFGEEPRPDSTDPDWSPTADRSQSSALRVQH